MPITKSAQRRARSNERKRVRNRQSKDKLKGLLKKFRTSLKDGKPEEAKTLNREVSSAFDKAVKTGLVRKKTASRLRSRAALAANKLAAAKAPAA